jgi:hypothetical protein
MTRSDRKARSDHTQRELLESKNPAKVSASSPQGKRAMFAKQSDMRTKPGFHQ